ncbi:MAG: hypothetical protein ACOCP8_05685 [archaeon]
MRKYKEFVEFNYWESEKWYFYISLENNENALKIMEDKLKNSSLPFQITCDKILTEQEVDYLCNQESKTTYMPTYNKLDGRLIVPSDSVDWYYCLYKGKIENFIMNENMGEIINKVEKKD